MGCGGVGDVFFPPTHSAAPGAHTLLSCFHIRECVSCSVFSRVPPRETRQTGEERWKAVVPPG